jgi:hypothetical protein
MLNYLYALLESEARLAAAALGLDPGLGVMHFDSRTRDSLACDLMEPVRPQVDAYLLDWLSREPLRREWFFEQRNGNCRLMGSFAMRLSETATTWGRAVAPVTEWVTRMLWSTLSKSPRQPYPPTRLTQGRRRQAKGSSSDLPDKPAPRPPRVCRVCGVLTKRTYCTSCGSTIATEKLIKAARQGRVAAQSQEAQARRADTQRRHAAAQQAWKASSEATLIERETYTREIQPRLRGVRIPRIMTALSVSKGYASAIRAGRRIPHSRHWQRLASLASVPPG